VWGPGISSAATTGPQWGLSWTYDGFGNRLAQNVTKGTAPVVSLSISAATNRITTSGFAYDAAGNLVQWPGGTVTMGAEYDVDGRLTRVTHDGWPAIRYYYDARNRKVKRGFYYQVYGLGGELLGEYRPIPNSTVPEMWLERVYFAGRLVATVEEDGTSAVTNTDRLGSVRAARRYPFGEGNNADNDEFATYRKDTTAQHYYAWHRFYSATWGRFSSPDPYIMSGGLTNPQGWNRYSYVANDPVNYADEPGLFRHCPRGDGCRVDPDREFEASNAGLDTKISGTESNTSKNGGGWEQPRGGAGSKPKESRLDKDALVAGAERLIQKDDCKKFVVMALQKGFLDVNMVASADQLGQYERSVYDSLNTDLVLGALRSAIFREGGTAPTQKIGTETFTTLATVKYEAENPSAVIFYDPFFDKSAIEQYQVTLHEGVHLIWNIGDENLARGLGISGKTGPAASAAWHARLTEKCK